MIPKYKEQHAVVSVAAALLGLLAALGTSTARASESSVDIKLSTGAVYQARNDVQIPNSAESTRFALDNITGPGPYPGIRLEGIWNINQRHGVRLLLAPLSYSETGTINEQVRFDGAEFNTDQPVQGEYRFNSWRIGYRYHLRASDRWDLWLGGTLKVRDAEIKLTQGAVSASDDDLGLVPLLHVAWEYRISDRWTAAADVDALGGGPGRAIDFGAGLTYAINNGWRWGVEYRALEGGADTDSVYNFAWFNSALLTAQYRFSN